MDQNALEGSRQPLRIAMVCDMVPGQAGGSYISTIRFATLLKNKGHHVIIIAARDSRQPIVETYKDIKIYQYFSLPTPGSDRYYFQSFPSKRALRAVFRKEQIDIVHIMFPSYSCYMAKQAAREMRLPLIAHIHTQPENILIFLPRVLQTPFVRKLITRYLAWFVRGANRIICPSELGKLIYHEVDPTLPISVISNGVDMAQFVRPENTESFLQKFGIPKDRLNILFVGRFTEDKDPRTLLNAMPEILKKVPVHLTLMGTGPLLEEMRSLADALHIKEQVTFLGRVSDEDRLAAYHTCDLFVLPSYVELEGMVVLEAMACGKPILIANSDTSASKYFVRNNGLLFEPGNAGDLARQAVTILADKTLRERMGAESLSDAKSYDIHQSANKLEALYYSVL